MANHTVIKWYKTLFLLTILVGSSSIVSNAQDVIYTWNGSVSTSYDDPGNWENGVVPGPWEDVLINSSGTPLILDRDVMVRHFTVGENSSIGFESNLVWLSIVGNLTNLGTIDLDKGIVEFAGPDSGNQQYIIGPSIPTFHTLRFHAKTNQDLVLLTDINLKGPLVPRMGTVDFNGFNVNLLSGDSFQGSIGRIQGNLVDGVALNADESSGVITYNRYYPAGNASWRMVSTPITNATFEDWNDDIPTTGFTGADYPTYPSAENPWSNIRTYDETFTQGIQADRHFGFESISSITDPIDNQIGYFIYFTPSPTTLDTRGTFYQGLYEPTLTYSVSDSGLTCDGWNLIANPYPSAINWDGPQHGKSDLDEAIYAYDPNLRQYSSYVNGVSTGMLNNIIGSGQAFWVKANGDAPYVKFDELHKDNSIGVHMKQNQLTTEALVFLELASSSTLDRCVIGFDQSASGDFDSHLDAYKFYASDPNLPSMACLSENGEVEMSISMYPISNGTTEIDLNLKPGNKTILTLRNTLVDSYDGNFCFLLKDKELNVTVPFNQDDEYEFSVTEGTSAQDRFSVLVQALSYAAVTPESCPGAEDGSAAVNGFGDAPWSFVWRNELNSIVHESTDMTEADMAVDLVPGFYEVTVNNDQEQCNSAVIVVHIPEAEELSLSATAITAVCNDASEAGIQIDLDERFTWDLTIEDESGKFSRQIVGLSADTLLSGLEIDTYTLRAMSSCGNGMLIQNLSLKDPLLPVGEISTDQVNNETYVGMPIELRYESEDKVEIEWMLEHGDKMSGPFSNCSFNSPGEYSVEALIKNEHCKIKEQLILKVNDLADHQFEAENSKDSDLENQSQIELTIQENVLWIEFSEVLDGPIHFTVFNNSGQTVLEETALANDMTKHQLDLSGITPGIYYLNLNSAESMLFSEKFIRTH